MSLCRHHSALARGLVPCSGHPCQKHPWTKDRQACPANTRSARRRMPEIGGLSTRYLSPRRWSARRRASSFGVSRRFVTCILLRTASDDAGGVGRDRVRRLAIAGYHDAGPRPRAARILSPKNKLSSGGTAFPIVVERSVRPDTPQSNQSGNPCNLAASRGVRVRRRLGWTYLPCPIEPKPVVIVGAGLSQWSRPYTDR